MCVCMRDGRKVTYTHQNFYSCSPRQKCRLGPLSRVCHALLHGKGTATQHNTLHPFRVNPHKNTLVFIFFFSASFCIHDLFILFFFVICFFLRFFFFLIFASISAVVNLCLQYNIFCKSHSTKRDEIHARARERVCAPVIHVHIFFINFGAQWALAYSFLVYLVRPYNNMLENIYRPTAARLVSAARK